MSRKLHVNEKVRIKETGKVGIIKSRDDVSLSNGHVDVQYIVKEGNGISNWHSYRKNELEPIKYNASYPKTIYKTYDIGERMLTLCAVINKDYKFDKNGNFVKKARSLDIGYSICHPIDSYNAELGMRIAKKRTVTTPFCNLYSSFGGEFRDDFVETIMDKKAEFIAQNLDNFIDKKKNKNLVQE